MGKIKQQAWLCDVCGQQLFPQEDLMSSVPFRQAVGHDEECDAKDDGYFVEVNEKWFLFRLLESTNHMPVIKFEESYDRTT